MLILEKQEMKRIHEGSGGSGSSGNGASWCRIDGKIFL